MTSPDILISLSLDRMQDGGTMESKNMSFGFNLSKTYKLCCNSPETSTLRSEDVDG